MTKTPSPRQLAPRLLALLVMAVLYFLFAPIQIGGPASYVMINGISMEPHFHYGDLVIVHVADHYQVGDVVTYKDGSLANRYVIHRIKRVDGDHFVLQGDNNGWEDSYHPTQSEIVGKLWMYIPQAGRYVLWMRQPLNTSIVACLAGGLTMTTLHKDAKRKNSRKAAGEASSLLLALYVAGGILLAGAALLVLGFSKPLKKDAAVAPYQYAGVFSYTGRSGESSPEVYNAPTIPSGQPLFSQLVCILQVKYASTLTTSLPAVASTSQWFEVRIDDEQTGWSRTVDQTAPATFKGTSFNAATQVNLCAIEQLVEAVETRTGYHPYYYLLTIVAHSTVQGTVGGHKVQDLFEPQLQFTFDRVHFSVKTSAAGQTDPFQTTQPGNPKGFQVDNTTALLGLNVKVSALRTIGLVAAGTALLAALLLGWRVRSITGADEEAMIRLKYGSLLVDATGEGIGYLTRSIAVASIEDLVRLAEQHNVPILHLAHGVTHAYLVLTDGQRYHFVTGETQPVLSPPDEPYEL